MTFSVAERLLIAFSSLLPAVSLATTFANRPLGDVVKEAPIIVRGTAGESHSDAPSSMPQRIFTYTKLTITEALKGSLKKDDQITIRQPGGQKDGVQMVVAGAATFEQGEDVVVMLAQRNVDDDSYEVLNLTAGKYKVQKDAEGQTVLDNGLGGEAIYDAHGEHGHAHGAEEAHSSRITYDTFRKIAQGESLPEASRQQFSQAAPSAAPKPQPVVSSTPSVEVSVPAPVQAPQESKPWIPISFAVLAVAGVAVLWRILKKGS